MDYKSILDMSGAEVKMAGRLGADGLFRPVHHSEILVLQQTLTRPADATAYAAGDAVGATGVVLFDFDLTTLGCKEALIVGARLIRNTVNNATVRFRAAIHDGTPATLPAGDNAPHPQLWANRATRRGWVDFAVSTAGDAAGSDCLEYAGVLSNVQGVAVAPSDGKVHLILTTRDAFTPDSGIASVLELDLVV